jgi:hypothetical protein
MVLGVSLILVGCPDDGPPIPDTGPDMDASTDSMVDPDADVGDATDDADFDAAVDADVDAADSGEDAGPGGLACPELTVDIDDGADFVSFVDLAGTDAFATGGASGEASYFDVDDGSSLEVVSVISGEQLYAITGFSFGTPTGAYYLSNLSDGAVMHQYYPEGFGFGQLLYPLSSKNIVQATLITSGGAVSAFALANNTDGTIDYFEPDSFGTFTVTDQATIPGTAPLAGVAAIVGENRVIVAVDDVDTTYYLADFDVGPTDPDRVVTIGTATDGGGARNGACNENLCAFAELDAGAVTILDPSTSPPTILETRALGPEPLGCSAAVLEGEPVLVTMTSDDVIHTIGGTPGAIVVDSLPTPGTCDAAAGPRTAIVYRDSCVAATCGETTGATLRTGCALSSCEPCTPECTGRDCGSDGCGGSCGECATDEWCVADGLCEPVPP